MYCPFRIKDSVSLRCKRVSLDVERNKCDEMQDAGDSGLNNGETADSKIRKILWDSINHKISSTPWIS